MYTLYYYVYHIKTVWWSLSGARSPSHSSTLHQCAFGGHVHPSMPRQMTSTFVINHSTSSVERPSWVTRSPSLSQNLNTINSDQICSLKHCSYLGLRLIRLDVYVLFFYLPCVYLRQCACVPGSNYIDKDNSALTTCSDVYHHLHSVHDDCVLLCKWSPLMCKAK